MVTIKDKSFERFIDESTIQARVAELGQAITQDYQGEELLVIPILNGSFIFAADLVRQINVPLQTSFIQVSSYGNKMSSSFEIKSSYNLDIDVEGKHVILVEDIIDTGFTINFLVNHFRKKKCASLKVVTFLLKPECYKGEYQADYIGMEIPPAFVVGYGLDYAQHGRELPAIYKLKE